MKILFTLALITILNTASWAAPGFQGSFRNVGRDVTFYIRPEANITTDISVIDFYVRYPNTQTLTFSDPAENMAYLPAGASILIETGVDGTYSWIHFSYTAPSPIISSRPYTAGVETAVFTTTVTGSASPANLELVHREAEDPYVFAVLSGFGVDLRPTTGGGALDNARVFYPTTSADGLTRLLALDVVLPLNLLGFTAQTVDKTAVLAWKTAAERNVSHFEIERSVDVKQWEKIGTQKAGIEAYMATTEGYYFTDEKAFNQTNTPFYRLKMVDNDGRFEYSPIRQVKTDKASNLKIYPNPAMHTLTIENAKGKTLEIVNALGQVVMNQSNNESTTIDIQSLPNGIYFLKAANQSVRFIKN